MSRTDEIRKMYNASGVHPTTDPDDERSRFVVDRYENHLRKLIQPGMRALDLGCNAGRLTFAMEDMGAIATGIDCAEIPVFHARKVAQRRKSQCRFDIGDIAALPYEKDSFDFALLPHNNVELLYETIENLSFQLKHILSENGILVVIMHDEFIKRTGDETYLKQYDVWTGIRGGDITIPGKGVYSCPSCFWTVAFAKYIIGKHLLLAQVEQIEENRFLLVFCNQNM